ncbi:MAG: sulfite exporter TauE/SafE family protein, partial [Rhodanobacter sp.]
GAIGAGLLLVTSNHVFRTIVPWLMLAATLLFAVGPGVMARLQRSEPAGLKATLLGTLLVSVYGGYFNGGLGIVLLALLGLLGYTSLSFMNGVKNLISTVLTSIAVLVYALGGAVIWGDALLMMPAAILGGYAGARLSQHLPERPLRRGIVAIGVITTAWFFLQR